MFHIMENNLQINDIKKGITNQLRHSFVTSQAENKKYYNKSTNAP